MTDEETTAYVQNKGWQNPGDLLTSYRNLEKFAGGSKSVVALPGPDADEKALGEFYNKLGRPESPDKYSIEIGKDHDVELAKWFTQTAHAAGLSDKQAQTLFGKWNEMAGGRMQAMQQASAEEAAARADADLKALKTEWGQTYDKQIDAGKRAVAALGFNAEKLTEYENKLGTGEMLKLFATLGAKMGDPSFEGGGRSGDAGGFGLTPASAQQQLSDLRADQAFMKEYMNGSKDHVAKFQRLMQAAFPNG